MSIFLNLQMDLLKCKSICDEYWLEMEFLSKKFDMIEARYQLKSDELNAIREEILRHSSNDAFSSFIEGDIYIDSEPPSVKRKCKITNK